MKYYWVASDSRKLNITTMSTAHIKNCLPFIQKRQKLLIRQLSEVEKVLDMEIFAEDQEVRKALFSAKKKLYTKYGEAELMKEAFLKELQSRSRFGEEDSNSDEFVFNLNN